MVLFGSFLLVLLVLVLIPPLNLPPLRKGRLLPSLAMLDLGEPSPMGMQSRVRTARCGRGGVDLRKRRRWFAEGDDADDGGSGDADIDLSSVDPAVKKYIDGLQNRIKDLNHESAGRRHKLDELSAKVEALSSTRRQELEEDGKYKTLYEQQMQENAQLKLAADRAEAYEQQIKAQNDAMLARIPDDWKPTVTALTDDLPPHKLATWLQGNMDRFTTPKAPQTDAGTSTGGGKAPVTLTPEQELAYKSGQFESKEEYVKFAKQAGLME
jgi:flagellar biosynthesis chaperone FliJ